MSAVNVLYEDHLDPSDELGGESSKQFVVFRDLTSGQLFAGQGVDSFITQDSPSGLLAESDEIDGLQNLDPASGNWKFERITDGETYERIRDEWIASGGHEMDTDFDASLKVTADYGATISNEQALAELMKSDVDFDAETREWSIRPRALDYVRDNQDYGIMVNDTYPIRTGADVDEKTFIMARGLVDGGVYASQSPQAYFGRNSLVPLVSVDEALSRADIPAEHMLNERELFEARIDAVRHDARRPELMSEYVNAPVLTHIEPSVSLDAPETAIAEVSSVQVALMRVSNATHVDDLTHLMDDPEFEDTLSSESSPVRDRLAEKLVETYAADPQPLDLKVLAKIERFDLNEKIHEVEAEQSLPKFTPLKQYEEFTQPLKFIDPTSESKLNVRDPEVQSALLEQSINVVNAHIANAEPRDVNRYVASLQRSVDTLKTSGYDFTSNAPSLESVDRSLIATNAEPVMRNMLPTVMDDHYARQYVATGTLPPQYPVNNHVDAPLPNFDSAPKNPFVDEVNPNSPFASNAAEPQTNQPDRGPSPF